MPTRPQRHRPPGARPPGTRPPDTRPCAARRGYDAAWQRLRRAFLADHPLCADCDREGVAAPAREAHHLRKVTDRPDLRLDPGNLLALCKRCHNRRTARGE